MSFRIRLTLLASLAVAIAVVTTSLAVYYTDRSALYGQIDGDLRASLRLPALTTSRGRTIDLPIGSRQILLPSSLRAVKVSVRRRAATPQLLLGRTPLRFSSTFIKGVHSRLLSFVLPDRKIVLSTSLQEVDRNLAHLRWLLFVISLSGIGAAAVLGALVAGRALSPLRRLTETTEQIVATGDLSRRTGRSGHDEISRLSAQLDELFASLDASLTAQRQFVADASHELRTPIATLRANVELLADPGALDAEERAELVADIHDELESMTRLVGELVELARGEELDVAPTEFRLDEVVQDAVDRTAKRAPELSFHTALQPSVVLGVPERVERAVANLLDNARKWSPAGGTVDVSVEGGTVEVRDHGPGIADEDLTLVFSRFYRSPSARGTPGAGLGLSIVKQIADAHGGTVTAAAAPGGGAVLRLTVSPIR